MKIRCVVSCRDAGGSPAFFGTIVEVTQKKYDNGDHYEIAEDAAIEAGYEDTGIVYDENDGPDWLFANVFKTQPMTT